jgi:hypothetical protein
VKTPVPKSLTKSSGEFQWYETTLRQAFERDVYTAASEFLRAMPITDETLVPILAGVIVHFKTGDTGEEGIRERAGFLYLMEHILLPLAQRMGPKKFLSQFSEHWRFFQTGEKLQCEILHWVLRQLSGYLREPGTSQHEVVLWLEKLRAFNMPKETWRVAVLATWFWNTSNYIESALVLEPTILLFMDALEVRPISWTELTAFHATWDKEKAKILSSYPNPGDKKRVRDLHRILAGRFPKYFTVD